jgi:hypothetical protein
MRRLDIRAILADPAQRRELMVRSLMFVQTAERIDTTRAQAEAAYDAIQQERKARLMATPNSVEVCVVDAAGDKYCVSFNSLAYEQSAIKHARWRMRQRNIGHACRPLRLHVERYHDQSRRAR